MTSNWAKCLRNTLATARQYRPSRQLSLPPRYSAPNLRLRTFTTSQGHLEDSSKPLKAASLPPSSASIDNSNSTSTNAESVSPPSIQYQTQPQEPRLSLTFTCTVEKCGTRSTHEFTKRSYTRGIVIVQCPGCENRHLIADHLGWFKESTEEGTLKTVEDLMRAKGEKVRRGSIDGAGTIEYAPE